MSGWYRGEIDGWETHVAFLQAHLPGGKVDRYTAEHDLRVWVDRILAPNSRVDMPSSKDLGRRWGWPKTTAYRLLVDFERWCDPRRLEEWRARWNDHGTTVERQRNDGGTTDERFKPTIDVQWNDGGTGSEREWNDGGHTRGSGSPFTLHPPPSTEGESETPAEPADGASRQTGGEPLADEAPTEIDAIPKWACGHRGHRSIDVFGMVIQCLEAVRQQVVNPSRCATDAKNVLTLWRANEYPPSTEFAHDFGLVAVWAREAPDHLARNDIRGIRADGTVWGDDRSRSVSTLSAQKGWSDRLNAARQWDDAGRPTAVNARAGPAPPTQPRRGESTAGDGGLERLLMRVNHNKETVDGDGDRHRGLLGAAASSRPGSTVGDG